MKNAVEAESLDCRRVDVDLQRDMGRVKWGDEGSACEELVAEPGCERISKPACCVMV